MSIRNGRKPGVTGPAAIAGIAGYFANGIDGQTVGADPIGVQAPGPAFHLNPSGSEESNRDALPGPRAR